MLTLLLALTNPAHATDYTVVGWPMEPDPAWLEANLDWLGEPNTWTEVYNAPHQPRILAKEGWLPGDAVRYGCKGQAQTRPFATENGDLATVKLTPPAYPMIVDSVTYTLPHGPAVVGPPCNAHVPHKVYIFKGTAADPGIPPTLVDTLDVARTGLASNDVHKIEVPLTTQITLNTGEHLFVAIQMLFAADGNSQMCITMCSDEWVAGRNYWSPNGYALPAGSKVFKWNEMGAVYNIEYDLNVTMYGYVPAGYFLELILP